MTAPRPLPHPRPPEKKQAPSRAPRGPRTEPPLNPQSWIGALVGIAGFGLVFWIVQIVNAGDDYRLDRFGLRPRELGGLWGVVTMPFLHPSYGHLLSNTLPLLAIGWVVLLSGPRIWATVTASVIVAGGVLTWLVAPSGLILGASGLVFGWLGYLLARAFFARKIKWIIGAIMVLTFFGSLLWGIFPTGESDSSWPSHICGFAAGVGVGWLLHPRRGATRFPRRSAVS